MTPRWAPGTRGGRGYQGKSEDRIQSEWWGVRESLGTRERVSFRESSGWGTTESVGTGEGSSWGARECKDEGIYRKEGGEGGGA